MPPPRSGNSPEDPFFLVRNLEQFTEVLAQVGSDKSWDAGRSFERILPRSDFVAAKKVFDAASVLQNDERSIVAMAYAAHAAGQRDDALFCLGRLKEVADKRGSWGDGWQGRGKQLYHRLNVLLNGEAASRVAFGAFVDDLANRRASVDYLLPELAEVLELISPRLSWAEAWIHVKSHLSHFRKSRIGKVFEPPVTSLDTEGHTLADILFRAIDTTAIELTDMARAAAVELSRITAGSEVIAALLPRLWRTGGYHALQAAHIAWECRDIIAVRDAVVPWLSEMANCDDFAVRHTAMLCLIGGGNRRILSGESYLRFINFSCRQIR